MIEMYHPEHARVHPCAAEESELERLLREGWVRTKEELDAPRKEFSQQHIDDEFDARVDEMLREEQRADRLASRRRGSMHP
jgi:hypothetical protein